MPSIKLRRKFYLKPTLPAAKQLLGKYLVRKIGKKKLAGKTVETEAYMGPRDTLCKIPLISAEKNA